MKYWNGESFVTVHCLEQNGLPYISWEDFKPIRKLLAKEWKKRGGISIMRAETSPLHVTDYEPTIEILGSRFQEECKVAPAVTLEDVGEQRARELCAKTKVTFDEVWNAIQMASLVDRKTDRGKVLESCESKQIPMWVFGLFIHGGAATPMAYTALDKDGATASSRFRVSVGYVLELTWHFVLLAIATLLRGNPRSKGLPTFRRWWKDKQIQHLVMMRTLLICIARSLRLARCFGWDCEQGQTCLQQLGHCHA